MKKVLMIFLLMLLSVNSAFSNVIKDSRWSSFSTETLEKSEFGIILPPKKYRIIKHPGSDNIFYLSETEIKQTCGRMPDRSGYIVIGCSRFVQGKGSKTRFCFIFADKDLQLPANSKMFRQFLVHERAHCYGDWPQNHPMK